MRHMICHRRFAVEYNITFLEYIPKCMYKAVIVPQKVFKQCSINFLTNTFILSVCIGCDSDALI